MKVDAMQRRSFLTFLGGSAAAWPLAAWAQQDGRVRRVGVLEGAVENTPEGQARRAAFRQALERLGWSEGRNVRIDWRHFAGAADRYQPLARELLALQPDVDATTTPAVVALQQESGGAVPIVFVGVSDPIGSGFIASLARPGGNLTGLLNIEATIAGKWVAMLKEIAPRLSRRQAEGIERGLTAFAQAPSGGLIIANSQFALVHRELIIALAARYRLPAVCPYRSLVVGGGLASYGTDPADSYRQAARYIDRILKGEKPADLPVQQPVKHQLVLNLKTAKALGLEVPASVLVRADEVIE